MAAVQKYPLDSRRRHCDFGRRVGRSVIVCVDCPKNKPRHFRKVSSVCCVIMLCLRALIPKTKHVEEEGME